MDPCNEDMVAAVTNGPAAGIATTSAAGWRLIHVFFFHENLVDSTMKNGGFIWLFHGFCRRKHEDWTDWKIWWFNWCWNFDQLRWCFRHQRWQDMWFKRSRLANLEIVPWKNNAVGSQKIFSSINHQVWRIKHVLLTTRNMAKLCFQHETYCFNHHSW